MVKARKLRKRVKRLEREVAELKAARMWEPSQPVRVEGPEVDVLAMLMQGVEAWSYYVDDDEDWSARGYL